MNVNTFWNSLTNENKNKARKILQNYAGSEGIKGRIYELYEEGAACEGLTVEEYAEQISPNKYVNYMYDLRF